MKTNRIITLSFCVALSLALFTLNGVAAEEKHDSAKKSELTIPETADGIFAEISKHQSELADVVKNNKLADVHHHAFAFVISPRRWSIKLPRIRNSACKAR